MHAVTGTQKNLGFWVGFGFYKPKPKPRPKNPKNSKPKPKPKPKNPKYLGFKFFFMRFLMGKIHFKTTGDIFTLIL